MDHRAGLERVGEKENVLTGIRTLDFPARNLVISVTILARLLTRSFCT
jgi:hypothetical protein